MNSNINDNVLLNKIIDLKW